MNKISSERVILVSFLVDVSDVFINLFIAILSGSVVMASQALEGAADLLASGFLLIGITRSKKPSDRAHPYGYGRELYFWTFLSALATFTITAGVSFYLGLMRFLNPHPLEFVNLTFLALSLGIITNGYSMSLSFRRLVGESPGKKLHNVLRSSALIETKTAFILDLMGTLASILGLISIITYQITGDFRFDGVGAMAIGVTLAILAIYILVSSKDLLVGQAASRETEEKIIKAATSFKSVKKVISLRTLIIGSNRLLVNIEVNLSDKMTTDEIEKLIDKIEKEIKKEVPSATSIQIELETPDV